MKKTAAILLAALTVMMAFGGSGISFGAFAGAVTGETDNSVPYSETRMTAPAFDSSRYYKIYDTVSGLAVTYAEDTGDGHFVLSEPVNGNKEQEWQICADPSTGSRFRIVSKATGEALKIVSQAAGNELLASTVDLNDANQEWSFSVSSGMFTLRVTGVGKLTYSQNRVRASLITTTSKKFYICEISEAGWRSDWNDEFEGALDETKWNRADGHLQAADAIVMNTGGDEYVYTEDGNLVLRTEIVDYGGYKALAGMVDTAGKYSMSYGRVEMRAKLPRGYATFPALWMLGNENLWPGNGEIDIMEISNDGSADRDSFLFGTLHWSSANGNHTSHGHSFFNKGRVALSEEYHIYSLEWEHDQIRMYFDGLLYMVFNYKDDAEKFAFGDDPHFLILDNWLLPTENGMLEEGKTYEDEYLFIIDYIRTYKRADEADYDIDDTTSPETTVTSTASDVIARSHDWDNEMPIAVSPDGSEAAVADGVGYIYILDTETWLQKEMISVFPMRMLSVAEYSPDGRMLAVANLIGTIYIFDTADYSAPPVKIFNGSACYEQLLFTKDSSRLIASTISRRAVHNGGSNVFDGSNAEPESMWVFDCETGAKLLTVPLGGEPRGIALSDDGGIVALAMLGGSCLLYETEGFTLISELECGDVQLRGLDFSDDGALLAVTDEAGGIYLWSVDTKSLLRKMNTIVKTSMTTVELSPDADRLLVNSSDNCARLYNTADGSLAAVLGGFSGKAHHARYSPDGSMIAVGSNDGRIKLFNAAGEYLYTLTASLTEKSGLVFSLCFSPDGGHIYATTYTSPKAVHKWRTDGVSEGASAEYEEDFFYYTDGDNAVITGYRGNDRNIVIPSVIGGHTVTAIGAHAFSFYGNYIRNISITLPDTIKRIEEYAFYNVWSIKSITLPEGLEYIGDLAFHGCKQLAELVIPDSVTHIGTEAFDWCHGLKKVTVGGGLETVPTGAFGGSRGITEVVFSEGVTEVESGAFSVSQILRLHFPTTLTQCASDAFEGSGIIYGETGSYAEQFCDTDPRYSFSVYPETLPGDLDGDGELTVADALAALRMAVGLVGYSDEELAVADADGDGTITVADALAILRIAINRA